MKIKAWIQAFRLRTLPLTFSCILMGAFLADADEAFRWDILVWTLLTTLFLQVLSNLANDYGDASSGVDGIHRSGPKRTVSSGLIAKKEMKNSLIVFSLLSLFSGIYLLSIAFEGQWIEVMVFLVLGMASIAAAIKYTIGKRPYGYAGFGDLFVLIFFGLVGVGGSYYLHTHLLNYWIFLPATSCGLLAVGVLNVNNIRDIESDRASGKYSIPVRLGRKNATLYHFMILTLAVICMFTFVMGRHFSLGAYLFLLVIPLLIVNAMAVKNKKTAAELDPYLKQLALSTLMFVLLFGVGQMLF